jgi:hypothetical protein
MWVSVYLLAGLLTNVSLKTMDKVGKDVPIREMALAPLRVFVVHWSTLVDKLPTRRPYALQDTFLKDKK